MALRGYPDERAPPPGHVAPPPGLVFTGFFFLRPDMYNYLTYVQQAEDGAFFFENKLAIDDSRRVLLNPEWWIGLFAIGLSAGKAYVSDRFHLEDRDREVRSFYSGADPASRAALLDRHCITHVILTDAGSVPGRWLGESTPFRQVARVGRGPATIGVYARAGRGTCPAP